MTAHIHDFDAYAAAHSASLSLTALIMTSGADMKLRSKTRSGLSPDTCVRTPDGERRAGDLRAGDRIVTQDAGTQTLLSAETVETRVAGIWATVHVPAGTIGNARDLALSPTQSVMVKGPMARVYGYQHTAVVPAHKLLSQEGVTRIGGQTAPRVHLGFAAPRIIYAEGALLVCGDQPLAGITASTTRVSREMVA